MAHRDPSSSRPVRPCRTPGTLLASCPLLRVRSQEVAHVASGDVRDSDHRAIQQSVNLARDICGLHFAVRIGALPSGRDTAVAALASLPDSARAVLVAVDVASRSVEVVTGRTAAIAVSDRACELAVLAMVSSFVNDDIVGGIRGGVTLLAEHARMPLALHVDQP